MNPLFYNCLYSFLPVPLLVFQAQLKYGDENIDKPNPRAFIEVFTKKDFSHCLLLNKPVSSDDVYWHQITSKDTCRSISECMTNPFLPPIGGLTHPRPPLLTLLLAYHRICSFILDPEEPQLRLSQV